MTDLETLREELAAKTRALADSEAECERLRSQVIPGQALSEMLADAQRHGGASASALWRSRVDGLTEERDTLRAQLEEAQKEIERVSNALALLQQSGLAARDQMRSEILTLRSRLTACEPVIELVRFAELLKLAANESEEERNDKPEGARFGDILSNGWAGNRNPLKLFMFLRTSGTFIEGINIRGERHQQYRAGNRLVRVLPRETPDLWGTWKKLADALATTPDVPLPAKVTT